MNEDDALRAELRERRRQLKRLSGLLLRTASQGTGVGGPSGGGMAAGEVERFNTRIRSAQGIDEVEARIAELEARLRMSGSTDGGLTSG